MPYVKRIAVKVTLNNSLDYVTDEKSETKLASNGFLNNAIKYIDNENKICKTIGINVPMI